MIFIQRILYRSGEAVLSIKFFQPYEDDYGDWVCKVVIDGEVNKEFDAIGVDSVQAIFVGFDGAKAYLESGEHNFTDLQCLGGTIGDHGFPMSIPRGFGLHFAMELEKNLNSEIIKHIQKLSDKAKQTLSDEADSR